MTRMELSTVTRRALNFVLPALALTVVLIGVIRIGGGGADRAPTAALSNEFDLQGVPLSTDLRPWVEAALIPRESGNGSPHWERDVQTYNAILAAIENPETRDEAGDCLYDRWRADPTHFLWINGAVIKNYLLRRMRERNQMFARPMLADTSTAVGAFVHARRYYGYSAGPDAYRRVATHAADLDSLQRAWLTLRLAAVDSDEGEHLHAVDRLLRNVDFARSVGGNPLAEYYWQGVAKYLQRADRLDDALHAAAVSLYLATESDDHYRRLRGLQRAGDIFSRRFESTPARLLYERIVVEARTHGDAHRAYTALDRVASFCSERFDLEGALDYDRRALAMCLVANDSLNVPRAMMNLADDHRRSGRLDSSRVYIDTARRWVDAFDDDKSLARLPILEAGHCLQAGRYAAADSLLSLAAELLPQGGGPDLEYQLLMSMVEQGLATGQAAVAYRAINRLTAIEQRLFNVAPTYNTTVDVKLATAEFLTVQHDFGGAEEALRAARKTVDITTTNLDTERKWRWTKVAGSLALARGDLRTAERIFEEALPYLDPDGTGRHEMCRLLLGRVLMARSRYAEADTLLRPLVVADSFGGTFRSRLSALQHLAECRRELHDGNGARELLNRAFATVTPHSPNDIVARLYLEDARLLAEAGRTAEAGQRLIAAQERLAPDPVTRHGRDDVGRFLADLRRDITEARLAIVLGDRSPRTRADVPRLALQCILDADSDRVPQPAAAGIVRARPGSAVLAFFVGKDVSAAWLVDAAGVAVSALPGQAELEAAIVPLLADLNHPERPVDADALARVGRLLLGPATQALAHGDRLVIVADGILHLVPWYALSVPGNDAPLIDVGTIIEAPTVRDALNLSPLIRPRPTGPLLALGFDGVETTVDTPDPPRLRYAETEARRIAAAWSPQPTELRTGASADWELLRGQNLHRFSAIHVASHALARSGGALHATLLLAGARTPLTPDALLQYDLDADLVYLSCCEAAAGHAGGGAVRDLASAFLAAGARAVIASARRLDDEAALLLAEAFYDHWRLEDRDKATALRSALRDLRDADPRWRHPYYWAGMRLVAVD